jgi:hypothetical protein
MSSPNLWGTLPDTPEQKPPVTILKEQAELLAHLTNGLLQGRATIEGGGTEFYLTLSIVAPALDYSYEVLTANHSIDLYPVRVRTSERHHPIARHEKIPEIHCANRQAFEDTLQQILTSQRVSAVIASLLAQSKALSR